jgi:hypothetical protein
MLRIELYNEYIYVQQLGVESKKCKTYLNIEKYIHESYDDKGINSANPKTTFIAYGSETRKSKIADDDKQLLINKKGYQLKITCLRHNWEKVSKDMKNLL